MGTLRKRLAPGGFKVLVVDNGSGFDPQKSATSPGGDRLVSGYGIKGIRTRLEQVGGRVDIQSTPGEGSRVDLFVPLAETGRIDGGLPEKE